MKLGKCLVPVGLRLSGQSHLPPSALPPAGSQTPPGDEKHHPAGQSPPRLSQYHSMPGSGGPLPALVHLLCGGLPFLLGTQVEEQGMLRFLPALLSLPSFWVVLASAPSKPRWVALGCGSSCQGSLVFPLPLPIPSVVPGCAPSCLFQSGGIPIEGKEEKGGQDHALRAVALDLGFQGVSSSLGPTSPPRGGFPPAWVMYVALAPPMPRSEEGTVLDVPSFLPGQPAAALGPDPGFSTPGQKGAAGAGPAAFPGEAPQLDPGGVSGTPQPGVWSFYLPVH